MKEQNKGFIDKGLEKYKKFNKITLAVGVSAGVLGVAVGMPWLATLGFGSAAIDAGQIILLKEAEKRRNKPKEQVIFQAKAV